MTASRIWRALVIVPDRASTLIVVQLVAVLADVLDAPSRAARSQRATQS